MKTKCIAILFCTLMGIMASEQSWPAHLKETKLSGKMYKKEGRALGVHLLEYQQDFDIFSEAKLWLLEHKNYRKSFNAGTLDIDHYNKIFRSYLISAPLPHTATKISSFYTDYSKTASSLFLSRFEKIIDLHKNDEDFKTKLETIPSAIELAVYIDVLSALAQTVLKKLRQKTKPLPPLSLEHYQDRLPTIQSFLAASNSCESTQSSTSSTSSEISSCSSCRLMQASQSIDITKTSTISSDYSSDASITIGSSSPENDSPDLSSEETEEELPCAGGIFYID